MRTVQIAAAPGKLRVKSFPNPYAVTNALRGGDWATRASMLVMGLGNFVHKRFLKGILFLLGEATFLWFMAAYGLRNLALLPGLGGRAQTKVWNDAKGVFEYTGGDNSLLILLYGIATLCLTLLFALFWRASLKSAYKAQHLAHDGKYLNTFREDCMDLFDDGLHKTLLTPPLIGILTFTVLPLIFMISMAFTNYSKENDHLVLFNWVGLKNFGRVLNINGTLGRTFWSVLAWTLVWAVASTFLNYILGMILAMVINRKGTRLKKMWRFFFALSVAVPQFVSLLIMRTMLQPNGAVNVLMMQAHLISAPLPFFTSPAWARMTVIIVNLWVGIPFTMLQLTGILQNIPSDLYEAARADGAGPIRIFFSITLPYILFVTTPYLIMTFMNNVNNFNVIYLLSNGDPTPVGYTAGKTDLLITWLYKLTVNQQYYSLGSVIGIFTFLVLAVVSLVTYRRSGAYNNEEAFQG